MMQAIIEPPCDQPAGHMLSCAMTEPVAEIQSWPVVRCDVARLQSLDFNWASCISGEGCGQIGLACFDRGQFLGIAGRWCDFVPDVPVIEDPYALSSNIVIVEHDGKPMSPSRHTAEYLAVLMRLNWTRVVAASKAGLLLPDLH